MTTQLTSNDMRHRAHEQMEAALDALDAIGELAAATHLDHAIASLGLRTRERQAEKLRELCESIAS